ncbi:MAG TPA: hypothetical protein VE195_00385, partial [Acidobacteriaceae bacterium]|nr:hypothetical protein [Acidobacteriaceae bacterium]
LPSRQSYEKFLARGSPKANSGGDMVTRTAQKYPAIWGRLPAISTAFSSVSLAAPPADTADLL